MIKQETKNPVGRPSKYDPAYCDEIVEFCRGRRSITGFAAKIGVARDTITGWGQEHPEFSLAIKAAKAACALAYEETMGDLAPALTIFGLKNMAPDDYKDVIRQEQVGPGGGPVQTIGISTSDPIEAAKVYQRLIGGK
jgi:hypothetical protein